MGCRSARKGREEGKSVVRSWTSVLQCPAVACCMQWLIHRCWHPQPGCSVCCSVACAGGGTEPGCYIIASILLPLSSSPPLLGTQLTLCQWAQPTVCPGIINTGITCHHTHFIIFSFYRCRCCVCLHIDPSFTLPGSRLLPTAVSLHPPDWQPGSRHWMGLKFQPWRSRSKCDDIHFLV